MKPEKYIIGSKKFYKPTKKGEEISLAPKDIYKQGKNKIKFWEKHAREGIDWIKPWKETYIENKKGFSWFNKGKLNLCYNALDRHLDKPDKPAIIFIPENPKEKKQVITYYELFEMVNLAALKLLKKNVKKGDIVFIYMPMIPEAFIYMLACARIGAVHSVVFSAFSADMLRRRMKEGKPKVLITSNYYFRKGEKINLETKARIACKGLNIKTISINRKKTGKYIKNKVPFIKPEPMDANDLAFILYASGTTGKSKGGVMHSIGGYSVQAYWSSRYIFNLKENERIWCTADIGWITGHTYACYGPLLNNATTIMYEGMPNYPTKSRYLKIIEQNKVNIFYTAPTAIRMFALDGTKYTDKHKLNSLKILGSVGEPIDEDSWKWFFKNIGKKRCPIIDTYWQTETGSIIISSLPGIGPFIPTYAGKSFPGVEYEVVNEKGRKIKTNKKGLLAQVPPFCPSLMTGLYGYKKEYEKFFRNGLYYAEDYAFKDKDGNIRILGRSDDVIKVAGHRVSSVEIENAINSLSEVSESAVVSKPDKLRGDVPIAFVKIKNKKSITELKVINQADKKIGPISKPKEVYFIDHLPKTRSGKIIRNILKDLLINKEPGETGISNPEVINQIKEVLKNNKRI